MALTHRTSIIGFDPQDDHSDLRDPFTYPVTGREVTHDTRPIHNVLHETAEHDWNAVMIERWPGSSRDPYIGEKYIIIYRDRIDERLRLDRIRKRRPQEPERPEDLY